MNATAAPASRSAAGCRHVLVQYSGCRRSVAQRSGCRTSPNVRGSLS